MTYDVAVVGLGGMGSAAAYQLACRGQRVLGLERHSAGHDRGSSHGASRIIRQALFEDPAYVPLVLRAYELWDDIERESGEELVTLTGALMIGSPEGSLVTGSMRSAAENGLPYELLDAAEIRTRYPMLSPTEETVATYEQKAGLVRPEASVHAHLGAAADRGADLHFEEPVLRWEADESGEGVQIDTGSGTYRARRLVLAPGPWAPEVLSELGVPLRVVRRVQHWFSPEGCTEAFEPGRYPVVIWEPEDGSVFYSIPAHQGSEGGVKAAFHHVDSRDCSPDTLDWEVKEEETEAVRAYLRERIPALAAPCVRATPCMYTNTPDHNFVLSTHPAHPQVAVACGFSGHGYKFASVIGEILADLATEGDTQHPIDLFSPTRSFETAKDAQ